MVRFLSKSYHVALDSGVRFLESRTSRKHWHAGLRVSMPAVAPRCDRPRRRCQDLRCTNASTADGDDNNKFPCKEGFCHSWTGS